MDKPLRLNAKGLCWMSAFGCALLVCCWTAVAVDVVDDPTSKRTADAVAGNPEGLEKQIDMPAMADLLAYLASIK